MSASSTMLRRQVSGRARSLELGGVTDGDLPLPPPPENIPLSPTDSNLSPCSKKLFSKAARKTSATDVRKGISQRSWVVSSEGSEDSEQVSSDDSSDDEDDDEMLVEEVKDSHAFFSSCGELAVEPQECPSGMLPVLMGTSSKNVSHIVELLGWKVTYLPLHIDEVAMWEEKPKSECTPQDLAIHQSQWISKQLQDGGIERPALLITVAQAAEFDGVGRMHPSGVEELKAFLKSYSNASVMTITAVTVANTETGNSVTGVDLASVAFRNISDEVIESVVAREKAMGCIGGVCLEDPELRPLALQVDGSVDSIWGLPVALVCSLIQQIRA